MKKLALAALFIVAGTAAMSGTIIEPIVEPEVVVDHSASSFSGIIVPLLILLAIGAATL